jgi:hypothetical protein
MIAMLIGSLLLIPALAAPTGQLPQGRVQAIVSIVRGMEPGNSDMGEVLKELDGSVLELGRWRCTLKAGRCALNKVRAGSHLASAALTSTVGSKDYRFLGTSSGTIVQVNVTPENRALVMPQNVSMLVYKVERFAVAEKIGQ